MTYAGTAVQESQSKRDVASRDELFEFIPADADNAEDIVSQFFI